VGWINSGDDRRLPGLVYERRLGSSMGRNRSRAKKKKEMRSVVEIRLPAPPLTGNLGPLQAGGRCIGDI
jgi:hypothetical protein